MSKTDAPARPATRRGAAVPARRNTTKTTKTAKAAQPAGAARRAMAAAMPKTPAPLPPRPQPTTVAHDAVVAPATVETRPQPSRTQWVRQSCRLTTAEYGELTLLKKRAAELARPMKRGRLLRAGLHAMRGMSDAQLFALLDSVPDPEGSA